MGSMLSQVFPPKPKWTAEDIPDLAGKVTIVTGGNAGVGKETVKALLKKNAKVYLAARSKSKAEVVIADLEKETGKTAIFLELDLGNLASVRKAAESFLAQEKELNVLFNNAGVMAPPIDQLTADGYDLQFGTNVLGHYFFTMLLVPALLEAAANHPDIKARVVNTSSSAQAFINTIDLETTKDGPKRRKLGTGRLYAQSKFGNVVFTREFARRYVDQGIVSTSCNPGNLKSDLQRHLGSFAKWFLDTFMLYPAWYGAITQLWLGTAPEAVESNGKFFIPWARPGKANKNTNNSELGEKLWAWLEEQVKNH